jgi:hypothetical protein
MTLTSGIQNLFYVKSQAALGTGATITQSDLALRVRNCTMEPAGELALRRAGTWSATGLPSRAVQGGRYWLITVEAELMRFASYTDVDSSPLSPLLKACGALTATTYNPGGGSANAIRLKWSAAYNPPTAPVPVTIEWHRIGMNRKRATDCIGRVTNIAATGQTEILVTFEFFGLWETPVASTFTAASATYGASNLLQTPMLFAGTSVVSGLRETDGTTEQTFTGLSTFALVPGMVIAARQSVLDSATDGYSAAYLTRDGESDTVAFTVDAHVEGNANDDLSVWANWVEQAERAFSMVINEGSGLQKVVIVTAVAQYNEPPIDNTGQPFVQYDLVVEAKDPVTGATSAGVDLYFMAGT